MKKSLFYDFRFLFLHLIVIAVLLLFYFTLTHDPLYEIATNGFYHVNNDPWYSQPWVWALILAVAILFFLFIAKDWKPDELDTDVEEGTGHE